MLADRRLAETEEPTYISRAGLDTLGHSVSFPMSVSMTWTTSALKTGARKKPWSPAPYVIETRDALPFAADLELVAKPKVSLSLMSEVLGEEELTEFYR